MSHGRPVPNVYVIALISCAPKISKQNDALPGRVGIAGDLPLDVDRAKFTPASAHPVSKFLGSDGVTAPVAVPAYGAPE